MLVNCGHILSEAGKSSDLGGDSHLTGLFGDSLYISALVGRAFPTSFLRTMGPKSGSAACSAAISSGANPGLQV